MTWFTDNPLERLMRQKPLPIERKEKIDVGNHNDALPRQSALSSLDAVPELVAKFHCRDISA